MIKYFACTIQGAAAFLNSLVYTRVGFFSRLLYLQDHLRVLHFHDNFLLVGLKFAVFNDDEAEMLFCVTQVIINLEPASTAFRALVLYHSYIVCIKISMLTAGIAFQNNHVENTSPCLSHQSKL